jgi:hypothetical protein
VRLVAAAQHQRRGRRGSARAQAKKAGALVRMIRVLGVRTCKRRQLSSTCRAAVAVAAAGS